MKSEAFQQHLRYHSSTKYVVIKLKACYNTAEGSPNLNQSGSAKGVGEGGGGEACHSTDVFPIQDDEGFKFVRLDSGGAGGEVYHYVAEVYLGMCTGHLLAKVGHL